MISIKNVSFGYEEKMWILNAVNMDIQKGECILLCGKSGCGKTTITKLINGLIPHFTERGIMQGKVMVMHKNISEEPMYEIAKDVGSVFQNPKSQFFNLDTDSELAFGLENEGVQQNVMKERISETVDKLHIENLLKRNIFSLSGGEKQTLAFASVYAMKPPIYVLDEPTANLDERAIERLRELISLLKQEGHTIIIAEHRLYFLKDLIDRAFYIENGYIKRVFKGKEFFNLSGDDRRQLGLRVLAQKEMNMPRAIRIPEINGLYVENLCCGYKKKREVIKNLSFMAKKGEVLAITGKNGVGKTTLVRCLSGLIKEEKGKVYLQGRRLTAKMRRKECFLVMQDVNHQLFSDSVWHECEEAINGASREKIEDILREFDLLTFKESHPMALSGGQKQRLIVATASLSDKKIIIFDEPTSGLDYLQMKQVAKLVRKLADKGSIVIVVTHDQEFLQSACDRILTL